MAEIQPIVMPKWGLAMQEGMLAAWHVAEGQEVSEGPGDRRHRDLQDRQRLREPGRGPVAAAAGRRGRDGAGGRPAGGGGGRLDRGRGDRGLRHRLPGELRRNRRPRRKRAGRSREFVEAGGRRLRYLKLGDARGPAGRLHPRLRRRSQQLAVQPAGAGREPHHLRARPAGAWRVDQGGRRWRRRRPDRGRVRLPVRPWACPRRIWSATPWAARSASIWRSNHPDLVASVTAVAPAGLGPEISMEYIDGFITTSRGRKLKSVLEMLVYDPGAGDRRHGRGRAEVQAPGRRRRGLEPGSPALPSPAAGRASSSMRGCGRSRCRYR